MAEIYTTRNEERSVPLSLEFETVSKSFPNGKTVVRNLSFSVRTGEFFSSLGPSGCGKTTCLRMISGLERPSSGIIRMGGRTVNDVHPHKRNVHTVFQKYALFPHLNVFDNVAFGLRMGGMPTAEVKSRVDRMLHMVHLEGYAKRSIQQLSGGEQQRVALVRALVNEPDILLLDEPLAALDLKLREQMQQELASLQKKLGTTFIFVTHDQGEALTLSDRVAIMNAGNIEQIGTPTEVYEQPATAFVARFVGTTNVFTGSVLEPTAGGNTAIASEGFGTLFAKPHEGCASLEKGSTTGLVVRPEKIRVRVTAPSAAESTSGNLNVLRGTLIERIYFGPTTQIKLQISEQLPPIIALVANQTATKMTPLKLSEKYYAVWDASDSILVSDSPGAGAVEAPTTTSTFASTSTVQPHEHL
jgi:spermidine/putrescine transport system ATP-binding protein